MEYQVIVPLSDLIELQQSCNDKARQSAELVQIRHEIEGLRNLYRDILGVVRDLKHRGN